MKCFFKRAKKPRENTVVYCQIQSHLYCWDSSNIPCVFFRIHIAFSSGLVFSKAYIFLLVIFHVFLCIRWNNFSNLVTLLSHICVFVFRFMITFTYSCVFDGILFSNSKYTILYDLAPTIVVFWFLNFSTNVGILVYLCDITTISVKVILFKGSIAVFQFLKLNVRFFYGN